MWVALHLNWKKIAKSPVRALKIASKIGSAAETQNPRAALVATPDLIKFATTDEGIRLVQKEELNT